MKNPEDFSAKEEYDLLKDWYDEWVRINKTFVFLSLGIVAFTITAFELGKQGVTVPPETMSQLKLAWEKLLVSSLLSGVSICTAYIWIDAIRRKRLSHLKGEVFVTSVRVPVFWIGALGWLVSLSSLIFLALGLNLVGRLAFQI